jgi:15-cis-phytoene synthase
MSIAVAGDQRLDQALRYCRDVTRARARNFYYGLKLSPEPQRSALFTMYAWMRRADDLVDLPPGEVLNGQVDALRARLEAFRAATRTALAGHPVDDDLLWVALPSIMGRFQVHAQDLHAMLDGQLDDLSIKRYETFEQLRGYCYNVASTVGLICVGIWGYDDPRARERAVERGIAFQLTNILRDFKQDYDGGRVYLPQEDFARHGLDAATLRRWGEPERCERFVREQVTRAESFYQRSQVLDAMITARCRPTLWAMTQIYHRLLAKIQAAPAQMVGARRIRLGALRKCGIALQARRMTWRPGTARA